MNKYKLLWFGLVVIGGFIAFIFFFWRGNTTDFLVLEGQGCDKTTTGGTCDLVNGENKLQLRDCNDGETICENNWYELGKANKEGQYLLLYSEGIQMLTVYLVSRETFELQELDRYFYTEVAEECNNQKEIYNEECFPFLLTEEQRKDVWQTNQDYLKAESEYR